MNDIQIIKFKIPVTPVTKKNSQRVVKVNNRVLILPSAKYVDFENRIIKYVKELKYCEINTPISLCAVFYMPTRRRVDLTNLLEAIDDALVKAGILADDNCTIIVSHDGSRVKYDKSNPRIEITITPSNDVETEFLGGKKKRE